jgi:hypothetical protein
MLKNRSQGAWIWVAVAAVSIASLARAQTGIENARAYAAPVIKFLAGSSLVESGAAAANYRAGKPAPGGAFNMVGGLLPIYFIGLLFCFSPISPRSHRSRGRVQSAPSLLELFQRPPPPSARVDSNIHSV